ncbi:oxygenase MpaB family protein [Isoptericola jiangsuensis]|uniref:oxygenase MpaB family protein n=1 Tax=Isoptericola jiangsuensis TaxID=548579 RepID=UPI003AAD9647
MSHPHGPLATLQRRAGRLLFEQVSGGQAGRERRTRIHTTPGPRWFPADSAVARVHGDAAMFVGGLRALLLQCLHPLAVAAIADHSDYRTDPWGRLGRTSTFLAETTFATAADSQRAVDVVRAVHARVHGTAPDGTPYTADDPDLLHWVHTAEVDSFLLTHQRHGAHPLDGPGCDDYLAQTATVARRLGTPDPPTHRDALRHALDRHRPALARTTASDDVTHFLLHEPPLPRAARGAYALLAAAAYGSLPADARRMLPAPPHVRRPPLPARQAGQIATRAIRWALAGDPPPGPPPPAGTD